MGCYRKILRISKKDHVTNEEVYAKIQQAIRPLEDLLTIVKRRKLQWYGHVSCSLGLAKTSCNAHEMGKKTRQTEKEVRRHIREWTGMDLAKSQRAVKNKEKWRKLIVKASVMPQ